jgi:hypothetical protein
LQPYLTHVEVKRTILEVVNCRSNFSAALVVTTALVVSDNTRADAMRRILILRGFLGLALTLGTITITIGSIAGCSEGGTAGNLPDSIGPVSTPTPEQAAENKKKVEAGRTGYKGAPGIPGSGR